MDGMFDMVMRYAPYIAGMQEGQKSMGFDLESLAKIFKPSALELFAPGIGTLAGGLLSGIGGLLKGPSEGEKARKKLRALIENRLGQNAVDPGQFYAGALQQLLPQLKRRGQQIERRLGLDVGAAQGELLGDFFEQAQRQMFDIQRWAAQLNTQQEMAKLQMLSQLAMVQ